MRYACLARISPLDPVTGERTEIYVSSANDVAGGRLVNGLAGRVWYPALIEAPKLQLTLWNGDFIASVEPGAAQLPLAMEVIKRAYDYADTLIWSGASVEIWSEAVGTPWPWTSRFKGRVRDFNRRAQRLVLSLQVDTEPFGVDLLTLTYAGTGDEEGDTDLKGRVKPLVMGWASNVEPVLINAVDSVYQFSGYGGIEAVTTLYERGSAFGTSSGDHADYAALVAATIAPGHWATCLAEGLIRLGAPQFGVITGDIKGHAVLGGTPRLTGEMIAALATLAGIDSDLIDSATLDALDAALPYPVNRLFTDQISFLEAARGMALACNAQAGVALTGEFFVTRVDLDATEEFTLHAQGRAKPLVTESEEMGTSAPYWRMVLGANRSWRVHSADEIAFEAPIIPRGAYDDAETYREGNTVSTPNGATWIYIYATPTTGNDPPTWPTTSNTWWSNLTPPLTADGLTYLDGTPIEDLKPAEVGSDVTAGAQVTVTMASDKVVAADYTGAVTSGNLAALLWVPSVLRGGTSIKIDNGTTYTLSNTYGGTFAVDNTNGSTDKGQITISAITANVAGGNLTVSVGGVAQPSIAFRVAKNIAAPPSGGSSGAYPKTVTWSDGEFVGINTISYTIVVSALKTVTLASGETLYGTAPLDYIVAGLGGASRTMTYKWQYSVAGAGSWNDFGSGITGSTSYARQSTGSPDWEVIEAAPGSVEVTQSASPSAGDYDVRLVALDSATGRNCTPNGTATIEAKV